MDRAGVECGCGWEANGIRVRVSSAAAACGWEARRMGLGLGWGWGPAGEGGLGYMGSRRGAEEARPQEGRGLFLGRRPACLLAGRAVPACGPRVRPKHGLHPVPCQPGPIDLRAGPG